MVQHVTSTDFSKEVLHAKGLVVADFWAEWCMPCRRFGPIFEEVSVAHSSKAKFVKIDVEAAGDVASELGVQAIPTTIFFKDGLEVDRVVGLLSKEMLVQKIQKLA
jgi:thioredoxin 1